MSRLLFRGGARLATAWMRRKQKALGQGHQAQARVLKYLLSGYARAEDGLSFGLECGQNAAIYRKRVPLRTYEGFASQIQSLLAGKRDVLWPGGCDHFAVSSGTTAGRTKHLPVNKEMIAHFRQTGVSSLLFASQRCGAELFSGRHLFLGGATALDPLPRSAAQAPGFAGDLSGITALKMPAWAERYLYEPGLAIAQIPDWPKKIEAIADRCLKRDISMIAGIPSWSLVLAEALLKKAEESGFKAANLSELWPSLRCLIHGGVPLAPYANELSAVMGKQVQFHEVYPASEGFIAAQEGDASEGLRLLCDAGIYYEFLPLREYDESRLEQLGERALPLEGVVPGEDYVLIMSTPAGLSRYVIGDVVRFVSTEQPNLVYSGRTKLQLSAFGEHVIEKELTDCIASRISTRGLQVSNFHVAPVFVDASRGITRGRHEWWIAVKSRGPLPEPSLLAVELDEELAHRNDDYAAKRAGGGMEFPLVRLVDPAVFEEWQKAAGKWGGQNKMPRCRSDRSVADALERLCAAEPLPAVRS